MSGPWVHHEALMTEQPHLQSPPSNPKSTGALFKLRLSLQSWPEPCCRSTGLHLSQRCAGPQTCFPAWTSGLLCHDGPAWQSLDLLLTGRLISWLDLGPAPSPHTRLMRCSPGWIWSPKPRHCETGPYPDQPLAGNCWSVLSQLFDIGFSCLWSCSSPFLFPPNC